MLSLTYAGQMLYDFFTHTKDDYRCLLRTLEQHIHQSSAQIRVGCPAIWNPEIFYEKITQYFSQEFPEFHLRLDCFSPAELISLLKAKHLDVVLSYSLYDFSSLGLAEKQIASSQWGLVYSKKYFKNVSSIFDLKNVNFFVYDTVLRQQFESIIRLACQSSFSPKIRNCNNYSVAVFEMTRGSGTMLFGDWDLAVNSKLLHFLPLHIPQPVSAIYRADDANPQIDFFVKHVAKLFSR